MSVTKICPSCGCGFSVSPSEVDRRKYCSKTCYSKGQVTKFTKNCPICKKDFFAKPSNILRGKDTYCSSECQYVASRRKRIKAKCPVCNRSFETLQTDIDRGKGVFCSDKCFRIHKDTKSPLKCHHCGKIYYQRKSSLARSKFCSRSCQGAWKAKQNYKETNIEKIVESMLISMRYKYTKQFAVNRYTCDFLLDNHDLIIEADGDYWHSIPKNIIRDKKKDTHLSNLGYIILRLSGEKIMSDPEWCKSQIREAVKQKHNLLQSSLF